MRVLAVSVALTLLSLLSACESGGVPSSSIYILDRTTNQIISTPNNRGDITMTVGETMDFKIERLTSDDDDTDTSDVTTVSNYSFIPDGVASATTLGVLTANNPGTTRMEVRFRPTGLSDADRVYLDIEVVAAP